MNISLTPEQFFELRNDFWHIAYSVTIDGVGYDAFTDDDDLSEIPENVVIGEPGINEDGTELYLSHPALNWEDEVLLKAELDERAAFTAEVKAANKADRAKLRSDKRTALRVEARKDARKNARVAQRRADRKAARKALRVALKEKHGVALLAAEPVEIEEL